MPWLEQCKKQPGKVFFCPLIFTSSPPSHGWWVCGCWGWIIKFQPFLQRFQPRGLSSGHHKGHPETFHLGVNYVSGRGIQLIRPISKPSQSNCKCWMHLWFIVRGGWLSGEYWWGFTLGRVGGAAAQVGRGASGCGHRCSGKCWMMSVGEGGVAADTDHCV